MLCGATAVVTTDAPKSQGPKGPLRTAGTARKRAKLLGTLGSQPCLAGLSPTAAHLAALEENPGQASWGCCLPQVSLRLSPDLGPTRSQQNCLMTDSDLGAQSSSHSSRWWQ